ncbi:succinate dehydrogenase/fumarate reductase iron-sulfur subunit [Anaeromyxobacter sp. K]|uniref:Succinate dehydrogenase/fumarate reductase iron-sulfur subunit n=1 Tax=Anaeromyxobacter dehalogenans (strain ATCC BAA-258 / DSM 21875 / 2CP-1) TaxID=455488 RepID=B8JE91_ANAD2|nr:MULTISPECIES: succinate dehydrogenase/fumarate reductase iron-sulfur subunit [Anaeromyxobacter]ACG73949.1 succinate dehydrogenase/fumarate reductase iron-sulfur subunit [Anaeromyxobacter sp. K]ACL66156.1 succinate dehydrogenase/fumarate reductase iron-sulfur subunit [Anaeromyxobacter dehalogenans 2CP-1]HET9948329.1 succinate dehydrogenase/fumarate reductase iron-sulfur subunit [Longimicrobiales bacterium]
MRIVLEIWRQRDPRAEGRFVRYEVTDVSEHMSFLEMLDVLNQALVQRGEMPVAFDSDCREGICGTCGFLVNGEAHGPLRNATICQTHMRHFHDGDVLRLEPWRAAAFPVVRDLVVDRGALDRIVAAGGYVSVRTGGAPDANALPVPKTDADRAMEAAACIGCGACVAACPNASAALFTGAKITHLSLLPQGQPERPLRVRSMAEQARAEGFGHCTSIGECAAVCPAGIQLEVIARMNRDFLRAAFSRAAGEPLTVLPVTSPMRRYESQPPDKRETAVPAEEPAKP